MIHWMELGRLLADDTTVQQQIWIPSSDVHQKRIEFRSVGEQKYLRSRRLLSFERWLDAPSRQKTLVDGRSESPLQG